MDQFTSEIQKMAAEMLLNTPYVDQFVLCQSLPNFTGAR